MTIARRIDRLAKSACCAISIAALLVGARRAEAEPTLEDRAAAEALFDEAVALVEAGEFEPACERFAESQRRDPQLGTLLYLATCHEQQGKTASAWVEFKEALAQATDANKPERIDQAKQGVERVERLLSRLRIRVASAAPGQRVTVNGREVRTFDVALPYDPGEIVIEASAPGRRKLVERVVLESGGETKDVDIPPLPAVRGSRDGAPMDPAPAERPRDRTLAYIVGGSGLGVMTLGLVFGGVAMAEKQAADDACGIRYCSQEGLDAEGRANAWAWSSNITIGVGVAALATGVVFFFVGPEVSLTSPVEVGLAPIVTLGESGGFTVSLTRAF